MNRATDRPVLVVTGLLAEARMLRGPETICVSAPPASLAARLDTVLADRAPSVVVSFGLAGGLSPRLSPGTIVLASSVAAEGERWICDPALLVTVRRGLASHGARHVEGPIAAREAPVLTRRDKAELHRHTNAVAVDTESHIAARFAARLGLPFAVVRAVCDAAGSDLPPLAIRAVDEDGRLDLRAVGAEIVRRPGQLLQLPGTALSAAKAMRALGGVRRFLGPRLGL